MRSAGRLVRSLSLFVLALAFCNSCPGTQTTPATGQANSAGPEYDVATVKVNNTGSGSIRLSITDDLLRATNVQLGPLLETAFDIREDQIVGLPHWAQVEHYDITAKVVDMSAEQLRGLSQEQRRSMLQRLLEQRFHLQTHVETRTLPLLELSVAKGGIKFTEWQKSPGVSDQNKGSMHVNNDEMTATGVPMNLLRRFVASQTHMPCRGQDRLESDLQL